MVFPFVALSSLLAKSRFTIRSVAELLRCAHEHEVSAAG